MSEDMTADAHVEHTDRAAPARGVAVTCPHCGERCYVRTSRRLSESFRELWATCVGCGFKGKAHVAWDVEVAPSLLPNPKVHLPRLDYETAVEQFVAEDLADKPKTDMFAPSG